MKLRDALRSFRVRMTLLSVTMSAIVLIPFAGWAWTQVYAAGLARIDEQIRSTGERQLSRPPHEYVQWRRVEDSLLDVLGEGDDDAFFLMVKDWKEEVVYESRSWPASLTPDQFPTPEGPDEQWRSRGPRDERFGRGPRDGDWDRPPFRRPEDRRDKRSERTEAPLGPGDEFDRPPPFERDFGGRGRRPPPPRVTGPDLSTITAADARWRMGVTENDHFTMVLGINLAALDSDMAGARNTFLLGVVGAMALVIVASSWLAGRALRPVTALTATAEGVTAHGLNQRIEVGRADAEFERLIGVFNAMLARLERSFGQAVRFSADAAHELKTPLAVLQGELEAALQDAPEGSESQRHYSRLLDEVQRLKTITRKLLLLSLADTGQLKLSKSDIDFSTMAESAVDDIEILAPNLRVDHQIEPNVHVHADPDLVQQIVQNLVSNAAKYTDESGRVRVKLRRNGTSVRFSVVNSGPGIAEEDRARVFDRFYRADKSRGRVIEGTGLGLSLAREIARAHGGELTLEDTKPIVTKFTLTLPLS